MSSFGPLSIASDCSCEPDDTVLLSDSSQPPIKSDDLVYSDSESKPCSGCWINPHMQLGSSAGHPLGWTARSNSNPPAQMQWDRSRPGSRSSLRITGGVGEWSTTVEGMESMRGQLLTSALWIRVSGTCAPGECTGSRVVPWLVVQFNATYLNGTMAKVPLLGRNLAGPLISDAYNLSTEWVRLHLGSALVDVDIVKLVLCIQLRDAGGTGASISIADISANVTDPNVLKPTGRARLWTATKGAKVWSEHPSHKSTSAPSTAPKAETLELRLAAGEIGSSNW
eukprot:SAG11_NODE_1325_length_5198_cov_3.028045_2_plen_282_part_00